VLGGNATPLVTVADAFDPSKLQIGISEAGVSRAFPDGFIAGGSVAGLLRFQNHDLADARGLLGQLAAAITGQLNAQQALGLDLGTPSAFGGPLLAIGAPSVAPSSNNAMAGGVPVASYVNGSGVRVLERQHRHRRQQVAAAERLRADGRPGAAAGQYKLTRPFRRHDPHGGERRRRRRLSHRHRSAGTGGSATASCCSRSRPRRATWRACSTTRRASPRPRRWRRPPGSATPVRRRSPSLAAVSPSINPDLVATITFTDDLGNYSYSLVDSTATLPTVNGTGSFVADQPISLNGFELKLTGVPKAADTLLVARTAFPAGDNGNANALLGLRDSAIVGQQDLGAGVVAPGMNVTDAYAAALGTIGIRVQGGAAAAEQSAAIAADATAAVSEKSGVNLDEEAARLIQFQQSYQAAAKMLQIAQSLFDNLLTLGR
jgi:flagellar hook-associated protein 1 FlgK